MLSRFSCNSLSTSIFFSTNHLRSFCLSFFFLATTLTLINFLATTVSVKKSTTTEQVPTTALKSSSIPLLSLSTDDFRHHRFRCDAKRVQRRENTNGKINASTTMELVQPTTGLSDENVIPYDYDTWRSTSIMPRMVSKCEHKLMMELLKRFDQLTKKYSLEYMMIDGTLLGKHFPSSHFSSDLYL